MRFSGIHKLASYLMASSAFLALTLSGELGDATTLFGLIGIVGSWFWPGAGATEAAAGATEAAAGAGGRGPRGRADRFAPWWTAAAIAAFAYTALSILAGESFLIGSARFLVFMLVVKLFNRRKSKDYQQIYLLSFLMLVAGTTLNAELSYAVCFIAFVVTATWALTLFHLRREMEENFLLKHSDDSSSEKVEVDRILNSRRIVGPSFLLGTSLISLFIFFGSATIFLLFPRIGFGLFFQKSRSGIALAGFSERVQLGGHGLIRDDETVVMRIYVSDPAYRGRGAPELHWRGIAFDKYEQGKWSRSRTGAATDYRITQAADTMTIHLHAGRRSPPELEERLVGALHQEIYLEPLDGTSVLFGASTPLAFQVPTPKTWRAPSGAIGQHDEVRFPHKAGIRYVVWSAPKLPPVSTLRASPPADPERMEEYLQLPPELPERVVRLAEQITAGAATPYDKVRAVHLYLKRNYGYTLDQRTDDSREPLDYFLFDRKLGHCEYFSTAMAILLRAVGVPTRNVNGFLGGEWNEYGGYIAVRGGDAHSWVEVWFEGVGWVTWDPTPPGVAAALGRGGGGVLDRLRRLVDTLRLKWFKWVIEYDLGRQLDLLRGTARWLGFGGGGGVTKKIGAWVRRHRTEVALAIVALAAAGSAIVWWRRRRPSSAGGDRRAGPPHPIIAVYARTLAFVARRGHPRPPSWTPREHATALARRHVPGAGAFGELTELYYVARFDPDALAPDALDRARELAAAIREAANLSRSRQAA